MFSKLVILLAYRCLMKIFIFLDFRKIMKIFIFRLEKTKSFTFSCHFQIKTFLITYLVKELIIFSLFHFNQRDRDSWQIE